MLTGPEIVRQQKLGNIRIEPFDTKQVNPNSYNLRLGNKLLVYEKSYPQHKMCGYIEAACEMHRQLVEMAGRGTRAMQRKLAEELAATKRLIRAGEKRLRDLHPEPFDMRFEEKTVELEIPDEGLVLFPGILYLGHTIEYTETPAHVPFIEGRSSVGRLGMFVHVTAGFGDRGFNGDFTLEIVVVQPLRVYANVGVCQIAYSETVGEPVPYAGKYQGQRGPKPSGLYKDFLQG